MSLLQIIYMSSFASGIEAQIPAILETARRKNAQAGITGMLLCNNGAFIQVLEGEPDAVKTTFDAIQKDARHFNIFKLDVLRVNERQFASWSMGYHHVTSVDLKSRPDLAALFEITPDELARRTSPGIAQAVLYSFSDRS